MFGGRMQTRYASRSGVRVAEDDPAEIRATGRQARVHETGSRACFRWWHVLDGADGKPRGKAGCGA